MSLSLSFTNIERRFDAVFSAALPDLAAKKSARDKVKRLVTLAQAIDLSDPIRIVDVGANPMSHDTPYRALLEAELCHVTGFEPEGYAFDKLIKGQGQQESYHNTAVGDGEKHKFYSSAADGLSSLFELDPKAKNLFVFMGYENSGAYNLNVTDGLETKRLDDLDQLEQIDFLKIDIQGGELAVFQNARQKLSSAIAVQTEMRFCRIYHDEPCFGDVDSELDNQGFEMHCLFEGPICHAMPHSQMKHVNWAGARQLLDTDFIYVRNLRDLREFDATRLKKLAILADGVFNSIELTIQSLDVLEERNDVAQGTADAYRKTLPVKFRR